MATAEQQVFHPSVKFVLDAPEDLFDFGFSGPVENGGFDMVGFPPSFFKEITIEHDLGGRIKFEAKFADVSFEFIEKALVNQRRANNPNADRVSIQWGYFDSGDVSPIWQMFLSHANPSFGEGVEWLLDGYGLGMAKVIAIDDPAYFFDTIVSDCVLDIANRLGLNENEVIVEPTGELPRISDSTAQRKYTSFINQNLLPRAANVSGETGYRYFWGADKEGKRIGNALHFHTRNYQVQVDQIPTFTYLRGSRDSLVLEFTPSLPSSSIGSAFARGIIARGSDGPGKLPIAEAVNDDTVPGVKKLALASNYPLQPQVESPEQATNSIQTWFPYRDEASNLIAARNSWNILTQSTIRASLRLAGVPRTVGLHAGQFVRVLVMDPIPNRRQIHWSSGVYLVDKAIHSILTGSGYTTELSLIRDSHLSGNYVFGLDIEAIELIARAEDAFGTTVPV